MSTRRSILELATCVALLTACGSEYQPYTTALPPPTPPLEALLVRAGPNSTGTGTVAGSGIDCSISGVTSADTCAASLSQGNVVNLTAEATGGSTFIEWGDACAASGSNPTCTVTLSQALTVAASFAAPPPPPTYLVTVQAGSASTGSGAVSGAGINCTISGTSQNGDCSEELTQGSQLTLSATATGGGSFLGWGGACVSAGANPSCTITVSQATPIEASFALPPAPPPPPPPKYVVKLVAGSGSTGTGTVTGTGIACTISGTSQSGDCSDELVQGTQLTLTATATGASSFAGWGGACSQTGAAATCTITVSQAATVEASFTAPPPPSVAGFWSGTDAGTNIHYHITLAQSGSTLALKANCASGDCRLIALSSTGTGWLGASYVDIVSLAGMVSTSAITFTMNLGNRTVKFDGAFTSPTRMVGQVSSATMPPQSLTLDKQ